ALERLDPVAALSSLPPRFHKGCVVVVIGCDFQFDRRTALNCDFDATLALMGVPDAVVEAELNFLLDVAREIIRRHPPRVNIKSGFSAARIGIDELQLHGIPRASGCRTDQTTLAGCANS